MNYESTFQQFGRMLENLNHILEKGAQYAEQKKFDFEVLLNTRLAPDQFNLMRQVRIACDTAKLGASRLSGREVKTHDDNETTLKELQTRIQEVVSYLRTLSANDFKDIENRKITQPRWEGKYMLAPDYLTYHVIPNFYFHLTTAYAILRNNGVDVGKKDYLGPLPYK